VQQGRPTLSPAGGLNHVMSSPPWDHFDDDVTRGSLPAVTGHSPSPLLQYLPAAPTITTPLSTSRSSWCARRANTLITVAQPRVSCSLQHTYACACHNTTTAAGLALLLQSLLNCPSHA
jgi:hypothetical protein